MSAKSGATSAAASASQTLQTRWTTLYATDLPRLAREKNQAQPRWPVHLDHCFARIILDNVVGENQVPWTSRLKSPAVRNMSETQLRECIALGERISKGEEDLVTLNQRSLEVRGKAGMVERKRKMGGGCGGGGGTGEGGGKKRRSVEGEQRKEEGNKKLKREMSSTSTATATATATAGTKRLAEQPKQPTSKQSSIRAHLGLPPTPPRSPSATTTANNATTTAQTTTTQHPPPASIPTDIQSLITTTANLTPFRQSILLHLCQIPRGHYSTYASLSAFLQSSPRAVGNALRNNPFAPRVPCHRIVASGGGIGGFNGEWGDGGQWCGDKVGLLRDEGVDVSFVRGKGPGKGKGGGAGRKMKISVKKIEKRGEGKGEVQSEEDGKWVVGGKVWEGWEKIDI